MKNQKGITLIALVITIIILIILAGVSINLMIREDGIITKAKNAKEKYEVGILLEQLELKKLDLKFEGIKLNIDNYLTKLQDDNDIDFTLDERVDEDNAYIIIDGKYKFLLEHKENDNLIITYEDTTDGLKSNFVTYNIDTQVSYQEKVTEKQTCLSPKTFTPSKSGYTFIGWREDDTADETVLTSKIMGDSQVNLYAVFSKEVTITYNGNESTEGETPSTTGIVYYNNGNKDSNIRLSKNGFTKTDSIFTKWAMSSTDGEKYNPGDTVNIVDNTEFYAVWQNSITEFFATGGMQEFTAYAGVTYKLTVYGAQGGKGGPYAGGKGGYAQGNIKLDKDTTLYICVGGKGTSGGATGRLAGGYNGGGDGYFINPSSGTQGRGAAGGGATHIGTFNSTLADHGSTEGLFIVAGGGGGSGSVYGWNNSGASVNNGLAAGTGGGLTGGNGTPYGSAIATPTGATQTSGGNPGTYGNAGSFGQGGSYWSTGAGGGGGLYGGAGTYWASGASGGSGYTDGCITGTTEMANGMREGDGYATIEIVAVEDGKSEHVHTGSAQTGNGCYTIPNYHVHTSACNRTTGATNTSNSGVSTCSCGGTYETHYYYCNYCGASGTAQTSSCTCGAHSQYSWPHGSHTYIGCGKTEGETIDSYSLGCGYDE